jgi:NADPH-dependent 2,4-dienoyl-CoA reductase/sulfur reductase-like enzyme
MSSVVIAGSGQRGLFCAAALASAGLNVTVVERLPEPGGQEPGRTAGRQARAARRAGARFLLGTLAVQYDGSGVDVLGVGGAGRLACDVLIVATGSRPATRAELGITGDRCAGVWPGSAALHLTQAGVLLGHRPLIAGSGPFAIHCAEMQLAAGASEVMMTLPGHLAAQVAAGIRVFAGYRVASVHGAARVEVAVVHGEAESLRVPADALILAAGMRPMRNIEGAINDRGGVLFCQPEAEDRGEAPARAAAEVSSGLVLTRLGVSQPGVPAADTR